MTVRAIDFSDILLHKKSYKNQYQNILIQEILYKSLMGEKPLRTRFNKIDGFIKIYDEIRYLLLYYYERYNVNNDRIKYLISKKSGITDSISHNFDRMRIDSCTIHI